MPKWNIAIELGESGNALKVCARCNTLPGFATQRLHTAEFHEIGSFLSIEAFKKACAKERQEILSQLTKLVYEKRGLPDPWATPKTPPKEPNTGSPIPSETGQEKTPTPLFSPGTEWTPLPDHISMDPLDPLDPETLRFTLALFEAIGQWSLQCEAFCSNLERSQDPRLSGELYRVREVIMALDRAGQVPLIFPSRRPSRASLEYAMRGDARCRPFRAAPPRKRDPGFRAALPRFTLGCQHLSFQDSGACRAVA